MITIGDPGKKHQQTSSPNLQSWPFWIAGLIRLDLSNFDPWKNMLRLEKKFQTIFSIITSSMGNVVYYHQEHAHNSFFEGEWEFLKSGVIRRHLPTFNHFGDLEVPRSNLVPPKWWILSIRGCKIIGKGVSIDKTAIYMCICVVYHSKSLQRVYCGTFWQHFLVKIQKMWNTQFLSSFFFCNTLQIMFI